MTTPPVFWGDPLNGYRICKSEVAKGTRSNSKFLTFNKSCLFNWLLTFWRTIFRHPSSAINETRPSRRISVSISSRTRLEIFWRRLISILEVLGRDISNLKEILLLIYKLVQSFVLHILIVALAINDFQTAHITVFKWTLYISRMIAKLDHPRSTYTFICKQKFQPNITSFSYIYPNLLTKVPNLFQFF